MREKLYNIIYTEPFWDDLEYIYFYISDVLCNSIAADSLIDKIFESINELNNNPKRFKRWEDNINYRKILVNNYNIFYSIENNDIYIVHINYAKKRSI